jgi:hypothetical protein
VDSLSFHLVQISPVTSVEFTFSGGFDSFRAHQPFQ